MTEARIPAGWPWGAPPFYALIRSPLAGVGYQVASVERADEPGSTTVLLFSCHEKAEAYRLRRPQGFADWKVGPVPNWERLEFLLGSLRATVRYLSVDVAKPVDDPVERGEPGLGNAGAVGMGSSGEGDYRVSLESVLEVLGADSDP